MNFSIFILLTFALVALASAEVCSPGYYKLKTGVCRKCPKGTFQANADKYACRPCPPGKIARKEGSTKCTACPKNQKPSKFRNRCVCKRGAIKNGRKCELCQPGTFFDTSYCSSCNEGYFQPEAGQFECLKCPEGSFSSYGAAECVTCAEGEDYSPSEDECFRCKAGETFKTYSGCEKCPRNRYKPDEGNGPCLPCPIGTHSRPGAKRCVPCPRGTVLLKSGECGTCPAGSFFAHYRRKCKKCGLNEFTPHENVKTSCYSCSGKKFALKGSLKCVSCPKNKYLMKDGTCKSCPQGSVFERYSLRCRECGVNEFTRGDMTYCESCDEGSYSLPGSTTCFTCPENTALILRKSDCGTCPAGRYYSRYDAKCEKCYLGSIRPVASIETSCDFCPSGTTSNEENTECVPVDR